MKLTLFTALAAVAMGGVAPLSAAAHPRWHPVRYYHARWHHDRICRMEWRHHHRVRVCYWR
jgi:hypothetical protein